MFNICIDNLYAVFWIIIFLSMASSSSLINIVVHTVVPDDVKILNFIHICNLKKFIIMTKMVRYLWMKERGYLMSFENNLLIKKNVKNQNQGEMLLRLFGEFKTTRFWSSSSKSFFNSDHLFYLKSISLFSDDYGRSNRWNELNTGMCVDVRVNSTKVKFMFDNNPLNDTTVSKWSPLTV